MSLAASRDELSTFFLLLMKTNRITTSSTNRRIVSILGILLLLAANAQAQKIAAKQAIFTAKTGTNFAFGIVPIGKAAQKTFYYQNTGSDTLFIQSLELNSDSVFTIQFATLTIPPHKSGKVIVKFAPQATGSDRGTIAFDVANGVAAPTLALSGNGATAMISDAVTCQF